MTHAKNKVKWCLRKAEKELKTGKHRGLVKVKPSKEQTIKHIKKAEHNLKVTLYLKRGHFTDWCSSSLFYTIYHCFLAILAKHGYESRNQECTLALIASLIEDGKLLLSLEDLEKVGSLDIKESQESTTALKLREEYQYSTEVTLKDKEYEDLLELAKRILDVSKGVVEE